MKIERISYNKLRVTLSVYDLKHWKVNIDDLSQNSPQAQEMFWTVMKQAEIETGFHIADSQLIIEAIPIQTEGFVLIITRVEDDKDIETIQKYLRNKIRRPEFRVKRKIKIPDMKISIFVFDNFDYLCDVSIRIKDIFTGESKVYLYKNNYYLLLDMESIQSKNVNTINTLLTDYGRRLNYSTVFEGVLEEHATILIKENAVDTLGEFFK
jgi:adapter protein MecA 1/2